MTSETLPALREQAAATRVVEAEEVTFPLSPAQEACARQRAVEGKGLINSQSDHNQNEHTVLVYVDADGRVQKSGVIQGTEQGTPSSAIYAEMSRLGITMSSVIGLVHNHPLYYYSEDPEAQRYPSGGDVDGTDWDAADAFVAAGAGGANGADFSLFIIDTSGHMREFRYADKDLYKNLDREERDRGEALPDETTSDGTAC